MLLTLLLIYSLGILGVSSSINDSMLFFMFFLAAMGFGMFHTIGFSLTAKTSTPDTIGRNMGNFTSLGEIGRVSLPPLAVFATSLVGWRLSLGIIGIVGFLLFFIARIFSFARDVSTAKKTTSQNHISFLKDIVSLFKTRNAIYITFAAIIDSLASNPIYVFLPFLLVAKGTTPTQLGIAMAGFFVGSLFGKSLLGRGVDKLGNIKVFIFSEICMAISLLLISQSTNYLFLVLFSALLGIFTKGTSPVVQTMFSQLSHKDHYHKVYAVSELAIGLSAVITIIVMGIIADKTNIMIVFYIAAFLACLAILPILAFSKTKGSRLHIPIEIEGG